MSNEAMELQSRERALALAPAVMAMKPTPRYPSPVELEAIYAARDKAIQRLAGKPTIEVMDLQSLDRLGRFRVADELWDKCTETAREGLLNDAHHSVRSCARISLQKCTLEAYVR